MPDRGHSFQRIFSNLDISCSGAGNRVLYGLMKRWPQYFLFASLALMLSCGGTSSNSVEVSTSTGAVSDQVMGSLDDATCVHFGGWAWDKMNPDMAVPVDFYDQTTNTKLFSTVASAMRPDLQQLGYGKGDHAFHAGTPDVLKDGMERKIVAKAGTVTLPGVRTFKCSK
jgi:hypothetical protein